MLLAGLGIGALASQLGSVTVSAVSDERTGDVGGLQNTITNLGASIGTALAGAVLISALTSSFFTGIRDNPDVPEEVSSDAEVKLAAGIPFVSDADLEEALDEAGSSRRHCRSDPRRERGGAPHGPAVVVGSALDHRVARVGGDSATAGHPARLPAALSLQPWLVPGSSASGVRRRSPVRAARTTSRTNPAINARSNTICTVTRIRVPSELAAMSPKPTVAIVETVK